MPHDISLISTIAVGLALAFVLGLLASKLRLPPLVGYLLAGVAVGPFTPGFVGDVGLAGQLAEIGVILLMFGVGLHFSIGDLMAVRGIALPGAIGQIAVATGIGTGIALLWGWNLGAGLVLGLALSVASTVVLLRALEERNALDTVNGRIAVGWLIVEDLAMVLALVLLPALSGVLGGDPRSMAGHLADDNLLGTLALTLGKVALFIGLILVIGRKAVPWLLGHVARTGSRELFTLSVLALSLGIAFGSAELFGVSFALGAFFAGVVMRESDLSHQAATDSLPLQDAFAVLFFVSVGMLFDPSILVREPLAVLAVVLVIVLGKSLAAFAIVLAFGYPVGTALTVSASLAQIGEFSFILAGLGVALGLLPPEGRDLILAGALLSITLNPFVFAATEPATAWLRGQPRLLSWLQRTGAEKIAAQQDALLEARATSETRAVGIDVGLQPQELIARFPIFADLGSGTREELLSLFKPRFAEPGGRVIRAGDAADAIFFITSGEVEVSVAGQQIRLGPGDFFGEMALLRGGRRTADVTALNYCHFLTLDERDFRQFAERHPELRARIDEVAVRRRGMNEGHMLEALSKGAAQAT